MYRAPLSFRICKNFLDSSDLEAFLCIFLYRDILYILKIKLCYIFFILLMSTYSTVKFSLSFRFKFYPYFALHVICSVNFTKKYLLWVIVFVSDRALSVDLLVWTFNAIRPFWESTWLFLTYYNFFIYWLYKT